MKISSVGAELFHADRQTDRAIQTAAFSNLRTRLIIYTNKPLKLTIYLYRVLVLD